ncbi:hypothetical protein N7478_004174 [Penicillium angulare]|uniref:uncharacterized protein n=1 Tax=Penicillium angulare TaxID=116970 RepID=UPI0025425995|nr:uncharacterized protein N7478_004174 [Penicillium angulare]KAJ5278802.1 hypothetical protein N7478_004174 [Penicillium angulare]
MADIDLWLNLCLSATLVLISGAFAGLTIALMTQDELSLRVITFSGDAVDRENAQKVIALLAKGKHWLLVTLLLGNSIASEALPVILDQVVGGGLSAVLGSTILIVIFSEIIPQSICARHALSIGAYMGPFVSVSMYLLAPLAWPIGKLLDGLVGDCHLKSYKRSELLTLFSLHQRLGKPEECLHEDEVRMLHGALGLMDKVATSIMTPVNDVFSLPADSVVNSYTINRIKVEGYSQIPVHAPGNHEDIIGVLSTKLLLKYNPKSCRRVYNFDWTPIPVIHARTTSLNLLKIFQEKKYTMFLVGQKERNQVLGIITRKDLMESVLGHKIMDDHDKGKTLDIEKETIRQKQPRLIIHTPLRAQNIVQKPQITAISAPEGELLPLWVKSSFPANYGSFDYFNSAAKWKCIRDFLPDTKVHQEIELATTYEA